MKKLLLPVVVLLILGCACAWFFGAKKSGHHVETVVMAMDDRVRLTLPLPVEITGTGNPATAEMTALGCNYISVCEGWQASADFPETEKKLAVKHDGERISFETPRPDLLIETWKDMPELASVTLKHPDGSVIHAEIEFDKDGVKDEDLRRRLLTSITPGKRMLDLGARTEKLFCQQTGTCVTVRIPDGFSSFLVQYGREDSHSVPIPDLQLRYARPMTTDEPLFEIHLEFFEGKPNPVDPNATTQEGVLLGQKMEWEIREIESSSRLFIGYIPLGDSGWHFSVTCLCLESDIPAFFSIVEKLGISTVKPR